MCSVVVEYAASRDQDVFPSRDMLLLLLLLLLYSPLRLL